MKRTFAFIGLMVLVLAGTLTELDQAFSLHEPYFLGSGSWDSNGRTITMDSAIRLIKNNVKGSSRLWCRKPFTFKTWDVVTRFSISGKNPGGDGLAMWLTDKIVSNDGKAFGAPVQWKGLMIAVDTFDNNKNGDNPIIYGIVNNGAVTYHPETDGTELTSYRCKAPVRNTKTPVTLSVKRTSEKSIIVSTLIDGVESACFTIPNVELPEKTYLAYSASSLFSNNDIHDIIEVRVSHPKEGVNSPQPVKPKTAQTDKQNTEAPAATATKTGATASATNASKPAAATTGKGAATVPEKKNTQAPSKNQKGQGTEQKDPSIIAIEKAVEKMKAEVAASFETIIKSNEAFSKVIIELASHPPRDYNEELKGLSTVMKQLRQIVDNIPATKNTEELNKIKKNLDEVKEHLETVTQVMGVLTARLNAAQDDTIYTIRKRSSTGHWVFFVIFEVVFALGVIFWRQMKVEKAKVI